MQTINYCGYCPQIDADRIIEIEYTTVNMVGNHSLGYKKMNFYCPDSEMCHHLDNHGRCPLLVSAPNHP